MTTTNLAELLMQRALEAEKVAKEQSSPETLSPEIVSRVKAENKLFTLDEALPLVKERYDLLPLDEAISLILKARKAWQRIKTCDTCVSLLNEHWCYSVSGEEDFFDLDIQDFIETCNSIVGQYRNDCLDIPEWFVDDDDLREYFNDNSYEMWRRIDWGECLDKDSVREAYLEDNDIDLGEYVENFKIEEDEE